jgi:hypothetical protein
LPLGAVVDVVGLEVVDDVVDGVLVAAGALVVPGGLALEL